MTDGSHTERSWEEGGGNQSLTLCNDGRKPPTSFFSWLVECCFLSTETVGLLGTGAQDGHLDFHTASEL